MALREDVAVLPAAAASRPAPSRAAGPALRAGVIVNTRSHRNQRSALQAGPDGVALAHPSDLIELEATLADFARRKPELLVIDGGDGTVRDVLTAAPRYFRDGLPRLAILPSGKTNALALDLGAPRGWNLEAALAAADAGRSAQRAPLEVWRPGATAAQMCGFLFGAGAFVRATRSAQSAHGVGLFDTLAVAATLVVSVGKTLFGKTGGWRDGDAMRFGLDGAPPQDGARFLLLASTLERLPLGARPFGTPRPGAKLLAVDAPPRRLLSALPPILTGRTPDWLPQAGYRQSDFEALALTLDGEFVLDGEIYPAGDLVLRRGAPLTFVVP